MNRGYLADFYFDVASVLALFGLFSFLISMNLWALSNALGFHLGFWRSACVGATGLAIILTTFIFIDLINDISKGR